MKLLRALTGLVLAAAIPITAAATEPPKVVASIKPVHSLVAAVMQGVASPALLVTGAGSPHGRALRPSEVRTLHAADLVVWVGPGLETFLGKPLSTLEKRTRRLALAEVAGITLLAAREGGVWEPEPHAGEAEGRHAHAHAERDMHLWLDPANAAVIADAVAVTLGEIDPDNSRRYAGNAERLKSRLAALAAEITETLSPVRTAPYIVFHDAYQYFERRFPTNAVGSIAINPDQAPGAKRLYEIRRRILGSGVRCVFREPQFEPTLVRTVVEGTTARAGVLDPLGADIPPGPDAYFTLMRNMAAALRACLAPS